MCASPALTKDSAALRSGSDPSATSAATPLTAKHVSKLALIDDLKDRDSILSEKKVDT